MTEEEIIASCKTWKDIARVAEMGLSGALALYDEQVCLDEGVAVTPIPAGHEESIEFARLIYRSIIRASIRLDKEGGA